MGLESKLLSDQFQSPDGIIQGYGAFYNFKDDDSMVDAVDMLYNTIIEDLQEKEDPEEVMETPKDLLIDKEYTLISRKKIYSYLKNL